MNSLITSNQLTMTSCEIAELTGKRHSDVLRDIDVIQDKLGDERKFAVMSAYMDSANRKQPMWILDYEETMILLTGYSIKLRARVIARLQELEAKQTPQIPQSFAEALQLAADQAKQLELSAPKVAFVDNLVERTALMNATQVANKFGKSAYWLNQRLQNDAFKVYNRAVKRGRVFQQWFIDKGYGEMKQTDAGYPQALFTNSGEVWIYEHLISEGEL